MKGLVGKVVTIRINDRDEKGKLIKDKSTTIKGLCSFYGENLLGELTITLNRTPIFPFSDRDIVRID
jgi:hypothetical protein